ncbi:MAG: RNA polymerase sigma factor [Planctomycetaceae bacterium]
MSDKRGKRPSQDSGGLSETGEIAAGGVRDDEVSRLYVEYGPRVLAFLTGLLRNVEFAQEACQATFVQAMQNVGSIAEGERGHWLFAVARNEANRIRRRLGVEQRSGERALWEGWSSSESESNETPEQLVLREEEGDRVRKALDQLPEFQRQVVERRVYQQQTFAEIAEQLEIPLGTALTRMRLALSKLRELLLESDGK